MAMLHLCWLAWAATSLAQLQSFHPPGHDDLTHSINIPQSTAQSGSGSIYFQLKSSATNQVRWFALGQGTRMVGGNMFIVYSNGNNVTVSPRLGVGEVEPLYNSAARVSLLDGSGVSADGAITANIRCDSCITWPGGSADVTSASSGWIWSVKYGSPLNSGSVSAEITQHDDSGAVSIDLVKATGGSSDNPFLQLSGSSATIATVTAVDGNSIFNKKRTAHAIMMSIVFVIMLPFFALTLHFFPSSRTATVHGLLQILSLIVALVGLGLGVSMAKEVELLNNHHPIIGFVVVLGLTVFQPAMGLLQHRYYRKTGGKGIFAYVHRWFGRIMTLLGILNGGLGLQLAIAPRGVIIGYSVVAGVVWLFYCAVIIWVQLNRKRSQ
jgi:hypothetical protein